MLVKRRKSWSGASLELEILRSPSSSIVLDASSPEIQRPDINNGSGEFLLRANGHRLETHSSHTANPQQLRGSGTAIPSKARQLRWMSVQLVVIFLLSVFVIYYFYQTLLLQNPKLGGLLFSPSITLLSATALSSALLFLISILFSQVFDALRWQLASRDHGVSMITFLALSGATSLIGVFRLLSVKGEHRFWCVQRLIVHGICAFAIIIITADINSVIVQDPQISVPVVAGLAPFNSSIVGLVAESVIDVYFATWYDNILGLSTIVTSLPCQRDGGLNCTSVFLPGGVDVARIRQKTLNETLLEGGSLRNVPLIVIENAPGYELDFFPIGDNSLFNTSSDCMLYGQGNQQGVYLCVRAVNASNTTIEAGWSVCPSDIYLIDSCFNNTSWTESLNYTTSMSLFKRYATIAYDGSTLSILSVQSISPAEPANINPADLMLLYSIALRTTKSNGSDTTQSSALLFDLGWTWRLSEDGFPADERTPANLLRGFLTIPFQLNTVAWGLINYTESKGTAGAQFAFPHDLETIASVGIYRAMAAPWTVLFFIVVVESANLWVCVLFFYILLQETVAPNTSWFTEIDTSSKAAIFGDLEPYLSDFPISEDIKDYPSMLRDAALANANTSAIISAIKGWRIRVVSIAESSDTSSKSLVLVASTENERWRFPQSWGQLTRNMTYI